MNNKELLSGNVAMAETAVRAGCNFFAGYPITPQTEILEHLSTRLFEVGGEFVQAESELAAINMIMGACATGARVMTATAGMAVSLMMETLSYLVAAKYPAVVINLQRSGAGAGAALFSQTDYHFATKSMGHGGLHAYVLAPSTVPEAVDMVYNAFDFAEKYRTVVYILTDSLVGQVLEPVLLPDFKTDFPERNWIATGNEGRPSRIVNYCMDPDLNSPEAYRGFQKMYEKWADEEVKYEEYFMDDAEVVLIAWGSGARIAKGAVTKLREEGHKVGMFRPITLFPFPKKEIRAFDPEKIKSVLVAEVSVPPQLYEDVDNALMNRIPLHVLDRCWADVYTTEEVEAELRKLL